MSGTDYIPIRTDKPSLTAPGLSQHRLISGREPEISGLRASITPLIVHLDDEQVFNLLVRIVLERAHLTCELQHFTDGDATLEFCQKAHPDLLITDISHPGLDGVDLCYRLRDVPELVAMPVIICSAANLALWGYQEGVTCLSKPATPDEIVQAVTHALGRSGYAESPLQ